MMINQSTVIQRKSAIIFSKLDEEYLALDEEAGYCYSLNLISGRIWNLLEEPLAVADLCARLQREYTVDDRTCQQDVTDVLTQLADAGLVKLETVAHGSGA